MRLPRGDSPRPHTQAQSPLDQTLDAVVRRQLVGLGFLLEHVQLVVERTRGRSGGLQLQLLEHGGLQRLVDGILHRVGDGLLRHLPQCRARDPGLLTQVFEMAPPAALVVANRSDIPVPVEVDNLAAAPKIAFRTDVVVFE